MTVITSGRNPKLYYVYRWTKEQEERHALACGPFGESEEHFARGEVLARNLTAGAALYECTKLFSSRRQDERHYTYGWTSQEDTIFIDDAGHP